MAEVPLRAGEIIPQCGTTLDVIVPNGKAVMVGGKPVHVSDRYYVASCAEDGGLQRVRLALAAGDRVTLPTGWHPMETAPRDGTPIVLVGRMRHEGAGRLRATLTRWYENENDSPAYERGWCFSAPGIQDAFEPIAWMSSPVDVDRFFRQTSTDPVAESKAGDR